jgi:hypothetical protein
MEKRLGFIAVRVFVAFSKAHVMKVSSFAPKESKKEFEDEETPQWVFEAWEFLLRKALNLPSRGPNWLELPAMMRMVVTTPNVFKAGRFRSLLGNSRRWISDLDGRRFGQI